MLTQVNSTIDLQGLSLCVTIGALLATLGAGIDSLLLTRHVTWFNLAALRWWNYFDDLKIIDLPRRAIVIYIKLKVLFLGSGFGLRFFLRSAFFSGLLTVLAIYFGQLSGLVLYSWCEGGKAPKGVFSAAWLHVGGISDLGVLSAFNMYFDLASITATSIILSAVVSRNDYVLALGIFLDVLSCILMIELLIYATDEFRNIRLAYEGFGTALGTVLTIARNANCAVGVLLIPAIAYSSTILVPTFIYLCIALGLFILRETFKFLRWIAMHLLEKSVEDQKKTIFAHLGIAIGMIVAGGKAIVEAAKILVVN